MANLEQIGAGSQAATADERADTRIISAPGWFQAVWHERWWSVSVILAVLLLWEIAARVGWISTLFFPAPSLILLTLARMAASGALWPALASTLMRVAAGMIIGGGAGLLLGWAMGASRSVRVAVEPLVAAFHPLPKVALFPIVLVLLGLGEASKVALVALTAFFPMVINTLAGVQQIAPNYWEAAANYGATGWSLVRRVIVPGSLPLVLVGLRLAVNAALVVTIAVEMLAAREGLGATIWLAWQTLRTEELYAVLLVIGLLGLFLGAALEKLSAHLTPWYQQENR